MPAPVIAAQVQTECAWNPRAVSPVGAQGIAQFMLGTGPPRDWSGNGVIDVWKPTYVIPPGLLHGYQHHRAHTAVAGH